MRAAWGAVSLKRYRNRRKEPIYSILGGEQLYAQRVVANFLKATRGAPSRILKTSMKDSLVPLIMPREALDDLDGGSS